ncbi:MAG TPA: hypothetical protein VI423_06180 [Paenisporosarcina sp.]|nr:hypothetical protein [Paenisporosarcina sp.]
MKAHCPVRLLIPFLGLVLFSFYSCASKKHIQSIFNDDCPLSYKLEWTVVEEGVEIDKQIELLSKLSAAAKADADKLGSLLDSGSVNGELAFQLSKAIQSETIRKAQVSQDVFDEFVRVRTASCNIWDAIKNGLYGDDKEALREARLMFTDIQSRFSELAEKKTLVLNNYGIIQGDNSIIDNRKIYITPSTPYQRHVTDEDIQKIIANATSKEDLIKVVSDGSLESNQFRDEILAKLHEIGYRNLKMAVVSGGINIFRKERLTVRPGKYQNEKWIEVLANPIQ